MVFPRFDENLDKEIYGKDCVAAGFGRIKLSHFDDVFALFHDPIANLRRFSFQKAPLAAILAKFRELPPRHELLHALLFVFAAELTIRYTYTYTSYLLSPRFELNYTYTYTC